MGYDSWKTTEPDDPWASNEQQEERPVADFIFTNHGSIVLVFPTNAHAREHLTTHVSPEAMWYGKELVVEPRYVESLAESLEHEGFSTEV